MSAIFGLAGGAASVAPATHAAVITANDTADLTYVTTSLWLGSIAANATLAVIMAGGERVTFTFGNSAAMNPIVLPIRVARVLATGTANISSIVALWSS